MFRRISRSAHKVRSWPPGNRHATRRRASPPLRRPGATAAVGLAALLGTTSFGCGPSYEGPPADLVITNAKIVTIDPDRPRAEAVAVIGETIVAVGTNRAIQDYVQDGTTEIIDAGRKAHGPGLQ